MQELATIFDRTMKHSNISRRVDRTELESFVRQVLAAAGVAEDHSDRVAEGLVLADLRGVDSHGVARLEAYVENFEAGGFSRDPDIHISRVSQGIALVDGDAGPGHSVGMRAMQEAMSLAADSGVGSVFVGNSNHFGTAAYFTQFAADDGFVGIASTNVGPDVIPFGGTEAFLGTNPIGISVPTDLGFPMTLDMATSVVAMGKIDHSATGGDAEIPMEWAVDSDGEPTSDPTEVAALRPVGGPKGYGLAMMIDMFCGILSDTAISPDIGDLYADFHEPMGLGHWFLAIDVDAIMPLETFTAAVTSYVDRLKDQPTADGVEEIMVPGEPEARKRRKHEELGIPLNHETAESLDRLAERYELEPVR